VARADSFVKSAGDGDPAYSIGIENARLAAHRRNVGASAYNPVEVVGPLRSGFRQACLQQFPDNISSELIGQREISSVSRCTYPTERTKAVVKAERSHDVLHIRWIPETGRFVCVSHFSTRTRRFKKK